MSGPVYYMHLVPPPESTIVPLSLTRALLVFMTMQTLGHRVNILLRSMLTSPRIKRPFRMFGDSSSGPDVGSHNVRFNSHRRTE